MRPVYLITAFYLLSFKSLAQEYASYYKDQKQKYGISKSQLLITYDDPTNSDKSEKLLSGEKLKKVDHSTDKKVHIISFDLDMSETKISKMVHEIENDPAVAHVSPVLLNANGEEIGGITDQFIVR